MAGQVLGGWQSGSAGFDKVVDVGRDCNQANMSGPKSYNSLMHEVCVDRGWCGAIVNGQPRHVDDFIPESGEVSAAQFVDWLFCAHGIDPAAEPEKWQTHKDGLKEAFVRHMGADIVDASVLKWAFD